MTRFFSPPPPSTPCRIWAKSAKQNPTPLPAGLHDYPRRCLTHPTHLTRSLCDICRRFFPDVQQHLAENHVSVVSATIADGQAIELERTSGGVFLCPFCLDHEDKDARQVQVSLAPVFLPPRLDLAFEAPPVVLRSRKERNGQSRRQPCRGCLEPHP